MMNSDPVRPAHRSRPDRMSVRVDRSLALGCLLLGAAVMTACGGESDQPTAPSRAADLTGRVTAVTSAGAFRGTVLVEADPTSTAGTPKGLVSVSGTSTVLQLDGTAGDFRSLATGQWVRVWFSGPVAESYPVQGSAAAVKIDSSGVSITP